MARTPLVGRIRALARAVLVSERTGIPADELLEFGRSRRRFLQAAGVAVAAGTLGAGCATAPRGREGDGPRVAIIGAGVAGLHCAHLLKKAGVYATLYEAADRTGGRMFTKADLLNPGQTVELGGEFIDSGHEDILNLCREFKLELLDMREDTGLVDTAYFFGGKHYTDRQVLEALKPHVTRITGDIALMDLDSSDERFARLDRTSLSDYLTELRIDGWFRDLLEVAFVTEYGLDAPEQSVMNMLCLIGLDTSTEHWEAFGESDERFKVKGGNQRVVDELAAGLDGQIETGRRLETLSERGGVYHIGLAGGPDAEADYVVMTVPFSVLRNIDLDVELPREKQLAIRELGYGTNAKLMLGTTERPWRRQGFAGGVFSDAGFQLAWDNARMQPGLAAGITLYSGGEQGIEVGKGTPRAQVERLLPGLERAFPGAEWASSGKVFRMHWPSHAFTMGSYACYRPGQWSTISGHEIEPVGNLLFAGEHCSSDFQGYMNGGAETGRVAAESILAAVRR
jgi:monoamine oxidase